MSKLNKDKWNKIKSKGKKSYVLKSLIYYEGFLLLFATAFLIVFNRTSLTNISEAIFIYLCTIIFYIPLGLWVGNNSWNAYTRRFEK